MCDVETELRRCRTSRPSKEAGLPDYVYNSWFGVMAPAGTPKPILDKVTTDIVRVLQMPEIAETADEAGRGHRSPSAG